MDLQQPAWRACTATSGSLSPGADALGILCWAQTYLSMLCTFKYSIFFFFAGMVAVMTAVVYLLYPETKGLPIEEAPHVFANHWWGLTAFCRAACVWHLLLPAKHQASGFGALWLWETITSTGKGSKCSWETGAPEKH